MPGKLRKPIAITVLLLSSFIIGYLFWHSEWKYSLPTPVPDQYHAVNKGEHINITAKFTPQKNEPVFLHFFNPDCPCSRFNMPHVKELIATYGDEINFAVVVLTADKDYTAASISKKYGLTVPVLFDSSIAATCGVYSTPQAVLINTDQVLYYRGNYNRSRYCSDKKTNYAQIAIDSLLAQRQQPVFDHFALTAYGCSIPEGCKK